MSQNVGSVITPSKELTQTKLGTEDIHKRTDVLKGIEVPYYIFAPQVVPLLPCLVRSDNAC